MSFRLHSSVVPITFERRSDYIRASFRLRSGYRGLIRRHSEIQKRDATRPDLALRDYFRWLSVCLQSVGLAGCRLSIWLSGCLVVWLSGCLAVWLFVCLAGCLSGWLVCCLSGCLVVWLFGCLVL